MTHVYTNKWVVADVHYASVFHILRPIEINILFNSFDSRFAQYGITANQMMRYIFCNS